jgi:hypothetical protein
MTAQLSIPTASTSNLCALAADLAVNQILRVALQLGEPVLDTSIEFCGFTNRCITTPLARNANCPVDHAKCSVVATKGPLVGIALGELATMAGLNPNDSSISFTVEGFNWVKTGICQCGSPKVVRRFVPAGRKQMGRCSKCRSSILAQPIFTHGAVAAAELGDAMEKPLAKLGATNVRCVLVRNGDYSILFREPVPEHSAQ